MPSSPAGELTQSKARANRLVARLESVRDYIDADISNRTISNRLIVVIGLIASLLAYLGASVPSMSRHLWFDELFTYYIAKAPSVGQLMQWIRIDMNPPLSYLLVRWSLHLFGDSEFAVRLPFLIAFLVGSLCFCKLVAERLRPMFGVFAMLVFWSTPFLYYATEARPYALIVCFFGIAMLAWSRAIRPRRSAGSIIVLCGAVVGMMFSHYFAPLYLFPFFVAELWRWFESRKFDWLIWAVLVLPCVIPVLYLLPTHYVVSPGHTGAMGAIPHFQQASFSNAIAFYFYMLDAESSFLLITVSLALLCGFHIKSAGTRAAALMTRLEVVFTLSLLAIPLFINAVLIVEHGKWFPRYGMPTLLAYGILLAFLVAMFTNLSRLAAIAGCCVLLLYIGGMPALRAAVKVVKSHRKPLVAEVSEPPLDAIKPNLPLVAASGLTFLEMNKYESPQLVARLYYVNDRALAIRYAHATLFEGGFERLKQFFPVRANFEEYRKFVLEHPHFLVIGTPDYYEDWLLRRLLDIHATLNYLGDLDVPYKDKQVYEVTMPPGSTG